MKDWRLDDSEYQDVLRRYDALVQRAIAGTATSADQLRLQQLKLVLFGPVSSY